VASLNIEKTDALLRSNLGSHNNGRATTTNRVSIQKPKDVPLAVRPSLTCQTSSLSIRANSDEHSPRSFLDLEDDSPTFDSKSPATSEVSLRTIIASPTDQTTSLTDQTASTFDELVDRLLMCPETKAQIKYPRTFLTFYRIFAAPSELLEAIITRFTHTKPGIATTASEESSNDRILMVTEQWINAYPGDFAQPVTRFKLGGFLEEVESDSKLEAAAQQISLAREIVTEDDDTEWACSDSSSARRSTAITFLSTSSIDSEDCAGMSTPQIVEPTPFYRQNSIAAKLDAKLIFGGNSTLTLNAIGPSRPSANTSDSCSSSETTLNVAESAQRQAALLSPNPTTPFTKVHWRALMAQPDDFIARELTRIDWIMFSSIRPRDLVRHVTVPPSDRHRFPALQNVTRMIEHFNHLAYWVTNLVLLRDKPKHRAQALEKLMRVARKLRELNNYNALGALVAGVQGSAVHRLTLTRELVTPAVAKDFMKLEILMGSQKGCFAYRLAWDNTPSERVPFLPLHRRDLVFAEAGNKTFVGAAEGEGRDDGSPPPSPPPLAQRKINWPKFEVMGDVLAGIQRAQATPYSGFSVNEEVKALVLDGQIIKDDDELYARSVALEVGGGVAEGGAVRRKFTWLTRYGLGDIRA